MKPIAFLSQKGGSGKTTLAVHPGVAPVKETLIEQLLLQRSRFLRFLTSKVGPPAAEDILQSCYLKLVEKGPQVVNEENVVSWFYTVLRHATIDYYRRNAASDKVYVQFAA